MTQPTDKELREMECWIEVNIFGRDDVQCENGLASWDVSKRMPRTFATSRADSMEVLEMCHKLAVNVETWQAGNGEWFCATPSRSHSAHAPTLPLAICRFAVKLFSKT